MGKKEEVKKDNLAEKVENPHSMKPLELDWSHKEEVKFAGETKKK